MAARACLHRYDEATEVASPRDTLDPYDSAPGTLCMWGALSLIGAVTRACDHDVAEAWRMQNAARTGGAAARSGPERLRTTFGPTQVAIHDGAVNVELGQPGEASRAAGHVGTSPLPTGWSRLLAQRLELYGPAHGRS